MSEEKSDKIEEFKKRFGNSLPARRDQAAIERRRQHVWEMAMEGVPQTAMADILHVTRQTVASDIDYLRKLEQKKTQQMKKDPAYADMDIGVTCKRLESIAEEMMMKARYCNPDSETYHQDFVRYMESAQRAIMNYAKIRVETGVWPKAGVEIKGAVEHQVSFEDKYGKDSRYKLLDNPSSRRRIMSAVENALKLGFSQEAQDIKDAIPVEAKVVDSTPAPTPAPEQKQA